MFIYFLLCLTFICLCLLAILRVGSSQFILIFFTPLHIFLFFVVVHVFIIFLLIPRLLYLFLYLTSIFFPSSFSCHCLLHRESSTFSSLSLFINIYNHFTFYLILNNVNNTRYTRANARNTIIITWAARGKRFIYPPKPRTRPACSLLAKRRVRGWPRIGSWAEVTVGECERTRVTFVLC